MTYDERIAIARTRCAAEAPAFTAELREFGHAFGRMQLLRLELAGEVVFHVEHQPMMRMFARDWLNEGDEIDQHGELLRKRGKRQ